MTLPAVSKIIRHAAPGETRAVALDSAGHPFRLYLSRWDGRGDPARHGTAHEARIRRFADELGGAFLELVSGEEAFLRLKSRSGVTEGMALVVRVESEARQDKLARVSRVESFIEAAAPFEQWCAQFAALQSLDISDDRDGVAAAFAAVQDSSVTLPGGGQLHIDRTRALTAFDVDTSGRRGKGSAAARALSINRDAAAEMARQVSLRNLGGNLVLDCIGPLNKNAGDQIRSAAQAAFEAFGTAGVKVLRPSPLGLLEVSVPWRYMPLEDRLAASPAETELLTLFAEMQREADANPTGLYELELSKNVWAAYLQRRGDADAALKQYFSGRVTVAESAADESRMQKR